MDFSFTDEQIRFKESIIKFAQRELNSEAMEREKKGEFFWDGWQKCADFGIIGLPIPKEYGGLERDILTCVLVMEGLGYSCKDTGLLFSISSDVWTCSVPILNFGTQEQKEKYLPGLCDGTIIGGHAMTEPDSGSDAYSLRTTAKREGDKYIINGTKTFISNAPIASTIIGPW